MGEGTGMGDERKLGIGKGSIHACMMGWVRLCNQTSDCQLYEDEVSSHGSRYSPENKQTFKPSL